MGALVRRARLLLFCALLAPNATSLMKVMSSSSLCFGDEGGDGEIEKA